MSVCGLRLVCGLHVTLLVTGQCELHVTLWVTGQSVGYMLLFGLQVSLWVTGQSVGYRSVCTGGGGRCPEHTGSRH